MAAQGCDAGQSMRSEKCLDLDGGVRLEWEEEEQCKEGQRHKAVEKCREVSVRLDGEIKL